MEVIIKESIMEIVNAGRELLKISLRQNAKIEG